MEKEIYLDNSATTKICQSSIDKMIYAMQNLYGNADSLHKKGFEAEKEINIARENIAKALSVNKNEIYFTSGATESNNIAILGTAYAKKRTGNKIVTTAIEHSSVLEPMKYLESKGFEVVFLKPNEQGLITYDSIYEAVDEKTILVSIMHVNNETGLILPIDKVAKIIKAKKSKTIFHCDVVQSFGKFKLSPKKLGIDIMSMSSHKIHGPKGVGGLYIKSGVKINPIIFGGNQEKGIRSGTYANSQIIGFGEAVNNINYKNIEKIKEINEYLSHSLKKFNNILINSNKEASPFVINFSVLGIKSETLLHFLASKNIYVSSGSACSKGKKSYVLSAMDIEDSRIDSAIRVSFSAENEKSDVDLLVDAIKNANETLVKKPVTFTKL